jgi:hypothetical protein
LPPALPSQWFASFTSGASCEANGAGSIRTLADCSAAAAALGLFDTTAEDDGWDGVSWNPPYCYLDHGYSSSTGPYSYETAAYSYELKFNSGTNTGDCHVHLLGECAAAAAVASSVAVAAAVAAAVAVAAAAHLRELHLGRHQL